MLFSSVSNLSASFRRFSFFRTLFRRASSRRTSFHRASFLKMPFSLKASLTVETALLMPLILLVIFSVIYFDFYEMNLVVCHSAAIEQAISGKSDEELPLIAAPKMSRRSSDSKTKRTVSFQSDTYASPYSHTLRSQSVEAAYSYVSPTAFIRKARLITDN